MGIQNGSRNRVKLEYVQEPFKLNLPLKKITYAAGLTDCEMELRYIVGKQGMAGGDGEN